MASVHRIHYIIWLLISLLVLVMLAFWIFGVPFFSSPSYLVLQSPSGFVFELRSDCFPSHDQTEDMTKLQKGLIVSYKGKDLIGKSFGLGIPIAFTKNHQYYSSTSSIESDETSSLWIKRYSMDCMNQSKERNVIRCQQTDSIGTVEIQYQYDPKDYHWQIRVSTSDFKEELVNLFINNELRGDAFIEYYDERTGHIYRSDIGREEKTLSNMSIFSAGPNWDYIRFIVYSGKEMPFYYGREVILPRNSVPWVGIALSYLDLDSNKSYQVHLDTKNLHSQLLKSGFPIKDLSVTSKPQKKQAIIVGQNNQNTLWFWDEEGDTATGQLFKQNQEDSPPILKLDHFGEWESIYWLSSDNLIHGYNLENEVLDGFPVPGHPTKEKESGFITDLQVVEIHSKNTESYQPPMFLFRDADRYFITDYQGSILNYSWPKKIIQGTPAAYGLSPLHFVATSKVTDADGKFKESNVYAWKMEGGRLSAFPISFKEPIRSNPVVDSISDDNVSIGFLLNSKVMILSGKGIPVKGFPVTIGSDPLPKISFIKLSTQANPFLVVADRDVVHRFALDGSETLPFPLPLKSPPISITTVLKAKGDPISGIFVITCDEQLHGWKINGDPYPRFPIPMAYPTTTAPMIVDLEANGLIDILVGSNQGVILLSNILVPDEMDR